MSCNFTQSPFLLGEHPQSCMFSCDKIRSFCLYYVIIMWTSELNCEAIVFFFVLLKCMDYKRIIYQKGSITPKKQIISKNYAQPFHTIKFKITIIIIDCKRVAYNFCFSAINSQVSVYFSIFFISIGIRRTINAWTDCGKWNQSSLQLIIQKKSCRKSRFLLYGARE